MRLHRFHPERGGEEGLIITLVAVFMLFVVGAMAALAIDVVTLYTARSEAQLAADGAALAGARVLANSGMTSDPNAASDNLMTNAVSMATAVATQVAASNQVGGRNLNIGASPCVAGQEICVNINTGLTNFLANPQVTVTVQRTDLPTFFARIWGSTALAVKATATAEAYNPSTLGGTGKSEPPVAPTCMKPWLLPNLDPSASPPGNNPIFNADGSIRTTTLLGWETQNQTINSSAPQGTYLMVACKAAGVPGNCTTLPTPPLTSWLYLPGDPSAFPAPASTSVTCSPNAPGFTPTPYQLSVAGCVQTPIACNQSVAIDTSPYATRDSENASAVNCLAHTSSNNGDRVDEVVNNDPPPSSPAYVPFQFLPGDDNPIVQDGTGSLSTSTDVSVSDSLVTVPVFDTTAYNTGVSSVNVIGFVQVFLNPEGVRTHRFGAQQYQVHTMVTNLIGCGTSASGTPYVYGNGPSAVPVRLITPP